MKNTFFLKISFLSLITLTSSYATTQQNDKFKLLTADKTIAKSERKIIMGLSRLGLESSSFSFPVYFTPFGKNAKTRKISTWNLKLSQILADTTLENNYPFLIPNRYDKLIFTTSKANIITATQKIKVDISQLQPFAPDYSSYNVFKFNVLNYLNNSLSTKVTPILSKIKDIRYNEMDQKESETFITTKAKEIGMPASVLQSLLKSAYTFSIYMPKIKGQISIVENKYKNAKGIIITTYSTSLYLPLTLYLTINQFNGKQFSKLTEVNSKIENKNTNFLTHFLNSISKYSNVTYTIETTSIPKKADAQKIFQKYFQNAFKENVITLTTRLKENRSFAITAPIKNVKDNKLFMNLGIQEDIRVDHPFKIYRTQNNQETFVAFVKVKKPGLNCLSLPKEQQTLSQASIIYGKNVEEADLSVEYPWTGVFGSVYYENSMSHFTISDKKTDTGTTNILLIGFNSDLGYILNNPFLSETWINFHLGFGAANYDFLPIYNTLKPTDQKALAFKFKMGLEKRYYLGKGFYTSGAFDIGYEIQHYGYDEDASLLIGSLEINPEIKIGYMSNPKLDFFTSIGYNIPLTSHATFTYNNGENELTLNDDYIKESALNIKFGVNIHLDFTGPFTKIFTKTSTQCQIN